jgi:hypothetical protein
MMAVALLVAGTFAWTNFNQNALNEWEGKGSNPGGTLHDDFNDPDKDVYIENWGSSPLFVRVRLDEYMEIGSGAGLKAVGTDEYGTLLPNPDNKSKSLLLLSSERTSDPGPFSDSMALDPRLYATIDTKEFWLPYTASPVSPFSEYWTWTLGGSKYYFPADPAKREDLNYVAQDKTLAQPGDVKNGVEAKETLNASVITMSEWIYASNTLGDYWIVDSDGWIYWANPLEPGTATGLLLSKVELKKEPAEDYYYAINVVTQMATADGVNPDGSDNSYKSFFNYSGGSNTASSDAISLLEKIADRITASGSALTTN